MIVNIHTNEIIDTDMASIDLCKNMDINPEVSSLYYRFQTCCNQFMPFNILDTSQHKYSQHRYYVYAWHTKTVPKKYFYVGKGTGKRYNHILQDINKYKQGARNSRFEKYSRIQDFCGIDCEIIIDGLTEYEALIYEECKKLEFLDHGEVLLNVEGIPGEYLPYGWGNLASNYSSPFISKDPIYQRYFDDFDIPYFDNVDLGKLARVYMYPYFLNTDDPIVSENKSFILDYLTKVNSRIYKTVSLKTQSIIVQGELPYEQYCKFRKDDKQIYNSKEVIDCIKLSYGNRP